MEPARVLLSRIEAMWKRGARSRRRGYARRLLPITLLVVVLLVWWQPRFAVRLITYLHPDVVFFADTDRRLVALTLDDGPLASSTPQLLDLLKEHEAHATFFLIGERIPGNEAIVERLAREGHELGNHAMADRPSIVWWLLASSCPALP